MPRGMNGALWVAALAAAVHIRSAGFGFVDLDDQDLLAGDRAFLARPSAFVAAFARSYMHAVDAGHPYYRPLVTASYALDTQLGGGAPAAYHLTNVALHAVTSALVFVLLRRLAFERMVAGVAAGIFAVHPVLADAVAWIPGRNDMLLAVFALAAWIFFDRACDAPSWRNTAFHLGFLALALLAKETASILPLVYLAHLALRSRSVTSTRAAAPTGPAAGTAAAAVRSLPLRGSLPFLAIPVGWALAVMGRAWVRAFPVPAGPEAIGQAGRVLVASLGQLVLPVQPALLGDPKDLSVTRGALALGAALVLVAVTGTARRMRRSVAGLGAAAFVLLLAPALAAPGTLVLESRLYLPAVGVVLLVAEGLRAAAPAPRSLAAFAVATLGALTALTFAYEGTFRDPRSFARSAVEASPHSAMAHVCLGKSEQRGGHEARALAEYEEALSLGAIYVVHNNIAVIHMAAGRWADAEKELRAELAVDPASAPALRNLAIVLQREREP